MKRVVLFLTLALVLASATMAFAATDVEKVEGLKFFLYSAVAAGISIAISSFGCGLAQGNGLRASVEGVARNPEASGKITVTMMIGLAMIESLCIYTLVICLILIYANPVSKLIQDFVFKA